MPGMYDFNGQNNHRRLEGLVIFQLYDIQVINRADNSNLQTMYTEYNRRYISQSRTDTCSAF
jgi:hypothetical protein